MVNIQYMNTMHLNKFLMSTSLLRLLPSEMVVMVANYLDVSSYLAFASSSTTLMGILYSER